MSELADEEQNIEPVRAVGADLKQAREQLDLSIDDIAQRTRIPMRLLVAIEASNYSDMPSGMYAVGFVRTYAKSVGLDANEIGERYRNEIGYDRGRKPTPEYLEEADPARVPPRWFVLGALVAAVIVGLAYWLIRAQTLPGDEEITRIAAGTDAVVAEAGVASATPAALPAKPAVATSGPVVLTAVDTVWLRVYERSGERLFERELAKGESWQLPTSAVDPLLLTGRPQALIVRVGGDVMPPLGKADLTVRDVSLKADALRALGQPLPMPSMPLPSMTGSAAGSPQPRPSARNAEGARAAEPPPAAEPVSPATAVATEATTTTSTGANQAAPSP